MRPTEIYGICVSGFCLFDMITADNYFLLSRFLISFNSYARKNAVNGNCFSGGYPNNAGPNPSKPGGLSRDDCLVIGNFTDALCFAFRTDNSGPPESVQVPNTAYIHNILWKRGWGRVN